MYHGGTYGELLRAVEGGSSKRAQLGSANIPFHAISDLSSKSGRGKLSDLNLSSG